ncbi:MAG TPA: GTPase Era, partial [Polyangium sp.]|nr:GTPase Era [Polyangium sp.]
QRDERRVGRDERPPQRDERRVGRDERPPQRDERRVGRDERRPAREERGARRDELRTKRDENPTPRPTPPRPVRDKRQAPVPSGPQRSGTVAIIGRPNVGKSTMLNAALEQPLAIVSPTPQTTRNALLGVVHHGSAEIAFLDTPGLHRPRTQLGRIMNEAARDAARRADVVVFVTDIAPRPAARSAKDNPDREPPPLVPHPGDLVLFADLADNRPALLVVNKVDLVRDKQRLLPLLEAYGRAYSFTSIIPISAQREDGVAIILDEVAKLVPEGPWRHEADDVTDKPSRYFAAEYVREQILQATEDEVPHATTVTIERYVEPRAPGLAVQIDATIHVERPGQKKILIGAGGSMLKRVGIAARKRIEELVGEKVVLRLWVRVTPDWRESVARLDELGYGKSEPQVTTMIVASAAEAAVSEGSDDVDELDDDDEDEDFEDEDELDDEDEDEDLDDEEDADEEGEN